MIKGEEYYEVKDMTKQFGVSRKQLSDYEKMGLLLPSGHIKSNYKIYDIDGYFRMAIISTYRKMGFPLAKINEILNLTDINIEQELDNQLNLIMTQKEELDEMIYNIKRSKYMYLSNPEDFANILFGKKKRFEKISDILARSYKDKWLINLDKSDLSVFCQETKQRKVMAKVFDIDNNIQELIFKILNDNIHYTHLILLLDIMVTDEQIDNLCKEISQLEVNCEALVAVNGNNSKEQCLGVIGIY